MADNLDTPYSRREIFYKGILDQDPDSLPEPQTREERYLKAIAEAYPTPVDAPVVQGEGSSTTSVMSQKAVSDALDDLRDNKLDKTGTAPLANNLTPYSVDSGATQSVPFINQGTGGGNGESVVDTGSYLQFKKKLGNTVGVNQLAGSLGSVGVAQNCTKSYDSGTGIATYTPTNYASDNVGVYDISSAIVGRMYIISMQIKLGKATNVRFSIGGDSETKAIAAGSYVLFQRIATATSTGSFAFYVECGSASWSNETFEVKNLWAIDLTLWYGSNDRIPSDILSHPENWGRYYAGSLAYAAGYLDSADGSVLTSIGRQMWDEEWEVGGYSDVTGDKNDFTNRIRNKTPIKVIPNSEIYIFRPTGYYFYPFWYDASGNYVGTASSHESGAITVPSNAHYLCFHLWKPGWSDPTYNHDVTISLYYPGESGYDQYYPYSVLAEVDTGSEVLRSAGAVADEKTPDGTITRNVGTPVTLDLSTMTFTREDGQTQWYSSTQPFASYKKPASNFDKANAQSGRFVCMAYTDLASNSGFGITSTGMLGISNDIYTNRASYTSVEFFCEAATPTTEQGTPFSGASADNFAIDDFGSMYWTQTNGVPQGVEIFYPYDYKAAVDTLLNMVNGDVEELVTETELGAVANRIPEAPAEDGTYTLKATVADGVKTYVWVADE